MYTREQTKHTTTQHTTHNTQLSRSDEHTGFCFERDLGVAADMIRLHSGGKNSVALNGLRGGATDPSALLADRTSREPEAGCCGGVLG